MYRRWQMRASWLVALAACAGATAQQPASVQPQVPKAKRAPYAILPGELGDAGVLEQIPHHARLVRVGRASLEVGGEPLTGTSESEADDVIAVIGEARERVRVVSDEDDARLAVWIDRTDLAATVLAPVQIGGSPDTGVWLEPGADVQLAQGHRDGARELWLLDDVVRAGGWVRDELLGTVWVGPVPRSGGGDGHYVVVGSVVRSAPDAHAPQLATLRVDADVTVIAKRGAWTLVELARPAARVRGFVAADEVLDGPGELAGHGHGTGYGISDTDRVQVSAHACLYDRVGGDVIGVNTSDRERYGFVDKGWGHVYVDTPWGLTVVVVKATGSDADPKWESCAKP
jgi:hypothetical protein